MQSILTVALTGGIACGKSIAAAVFKELGCYVHYSDKTAHQLMKPHTPAWKKIVHRYGRSILNPDQTINRSKLGKIVFENDQDRKFINRIIHPLVLEEKRKIVADLKKGGRYKIFISEAALTIESGFTGFYDKVVVVYCPSEVQLRRLMSRDGVSLSQAHRRIKSQMPAEDKKKYADYIIDSTGPVSSTVEQTEKVYRYLIQDYQLLQ